MSARAEALTALRETLDALTETLHALTRTLAPEQEITVEAEPDDPETCPHCAGPYDPCRRHACPGCGGPDDHDPRECRI